MSSHMDAEHLKRILIVDDESDVTELLDYKFKQAGYAIRTLNDPLRAIGLARDFRPDLIILDVMMPELTGVQLLRMVRADALLQDTPVIFLTAKGETADKVKGLECSSASSPREIGGSETVDAPRRGRTVTRYRTSRSHGRRCGRRTHGHRIQTPPATP